MLAMGALPAGSGLWMLGDRVATVLEGGLDAGLAKEIFAEAVGEATARLAEQGIEVEFQELAGKVTVAVSHAGEEELMYVAANAPINSPYAEEIEQALQDVVVRRGGRLIDEGLSAAGHAERRLYSVLKEMLNFRSIGVSNYWGPCDKGINCAGFFRTGKNVQLFWEKTFVKGHL